MSDISFRLDGLLLGMAIVAGGSLFLLIAIISALATLLADGTGVAAWRVPRTSFYLVLAHVVALLILILLVDRLRIPTGPDWIDWLAIPWGGVILWGLIKLVRRRLR
ncbi:MAG: hypothetical protein ACTHJR_07735 [Sphingomonas sp.]|uniref:hypothetical protein n=1 Tax=Sphingomonas sp. TaxID=28214 RepID=UPI003F7CF68C